MRVIHITHQFPPETHGGVEAHVTSLAHGLKKRGHKVAIVSGSLEPWEEVGGSWELCDGLDVYRLHRSDLFFDAWDRMLCPELGDHLISVLKEWRPDVIHLHHWIRLTPDLLHRIRTCAGPLSSVRIIVTLHDFASSCPRGFRMKPDDSPCREALTVEHCLHCAPRWPWMGDRETATALDAFAATSRSELSQANAVVCASAFLRDTIIDGLNAPRLGRLFHVLPFGHEPVFGGMRTVQDAEEVFRFAYWGSITYRKGLALLLRAFRQLLDGRAPDSRAVELHLFGTCDTPEREAELRELAQGLPVTFHGRYEYADIAGAGLHGAVFPSLCMETYGLVLDEAFELGLPVVVADLGAFAERCGGAGRTFAAGDSGSLACALGALVDDPALHARLREAVPRELPSFETFVDGMLTLYGGEGTPLDVDEAYPPLSAEEQLRLQLMRNQTAFASLLQRGSPVSFEPR